MQRHLLSGITNAPCTAIRRPTALYSQNVPWKPSIANKLGYTYKYINIFTFLINHMHGLTLRWII